MATPTHSPSLSSFLTRPEDLDFINNLLLEKERPLSTLAIAKRLIEERLEAERRALLERFSNASFYNPAASFEIGDRLIFPAMNYAAGVVTGKRAGTHPDLEPFVVIAVQFEGDGPGREFASCLKSPHALSRDEDDDAQTFPGPALTVVVANAQFFGGGFNIAPRASMVDGLLDVQIITSRRREVAALMRKARGGDHLADPGVRRFVAPEARIETDEPLPVEVDGEPLGRTPLVVRLQAGCLSLMV